MKNLLSEFYKGKTVLVTGHTGFKGSWLAFWLKLMGADVIGYSLPPENQWPVFYEAVGVEQDINSIIEDIRDLSRLESAFRSYSPDIVFHLAAQALVRRSYKDPQETYSTNVMGTLNLLETIRKTTSVRSVVIVTSDKCYENVGWPWGYREIDALGGHDPYSSSKACAEILTAAYRSSFFTGNSQVHIASARAGNVIGGGDWAEDRLVPDIFKAIAGNGTIVLRNPEAVRPWQHVLEPLRGYLMLAEKLWEGGPKYTEAWNFGPRVEDSITVHELTKRIVQYMGTGLIEISNKEDTMHEAHYLKLDCSKAHALLDWHPLLTISEALDLTVGFYKALLNDTDSIRQLAIEQINSYMKRIS